MISKINSDFPNFTPITFDYGVNIILAERALTSSNSVGKSLSLEIINFVFGADYSKNKLTGYTDLKNTSLFVDVNINKKVYQFKRVISEEAKEIYTDLKNNDTYNSKKEWDIYLNKLFFNLPENQEFLSWRNLFRYFFRVEGIEKFPLNLKSNSNESAYLTSLHQSFLIDIAHEEIKELFHIQEVEKDTKHLTKFLATFKNAIEIIPELLPAQSLQKSDKNIMFEINELLNKRREFDRKISLIEGKIYKLENNLNELQQPDQISEYSNDAFKDFYNIAKIELGEFIIKSLSEAKNFHEKLVKENIDIIEKEIQRYSIEKETSITEYNKVNELLQELMERHEMNENSLERNIQENIVLNSFVSHSENLLTKIVKEKTKIVKSQKTPLIESIVKKKKLILEAYKEILSDLVHEIYAKEKNTSFDVRVNRNKNLTVEFQYDDDTGSGKGIMKSIIYYSFILWLNHYKLKRNLDFLILDTGVTDGIDSQNLLDFLKTIDPLLKKYELQLILTLRADNGWNWEEVKKRGWVRRVLNDTPEGYLFKPNLK